MTKRFYLDTCIWRDYYENRSDRFGPLGEFAFQLILRILDDEASLILYSEQLIEELKTRFDEHEINQMLGFIAEKLQKVDIDNTQIHEAHILARRRNIPRGDALHAILARDNNAILVTRDMHFQELADVCKVMKPEELL